MIPRSGAAFVATLILTLGLRAGVERQYFDLTVKPQDDFFRYVNGAWLKTVVIPPAEARWGSFNELQERNHQDLRRLCERVAAPDASRSASERLVGDFYASGMDEAGINAAGLAPLQPELDRIAAVRTPAEVLGAIARLRLLGVIAGFTFRSEPDAKESTVELAQLRQSGLGLASSDLERDADRDNYFNDDEKSRGLRIQYLAHIAKMFELLGDAPDAAQTGAQAVMKLETALAQGSATRVQLRNPPANYHKLKVASLPQYTGDLDFAAFFKASGAPGFTDVNLAQPEFFRVFAALLAQTPVADWRLYLRWHLVRRAAPFLGAPWADENFRFFGTTMTGATERKPRWKQVVTVIDECAGEALGQLYVVQYFPPEAKARVLQLVANIRGALRERLSTLEWMDQATRAKALAKLDAFSVKIGYPDQWRDYRTLQIDRGPYVLNVFRASEFERRRVLARIGRPVDQAEWFMTAPTVNAYYSSSVNGITFPAGILQPPFFSIQADDALNYGGIGVVIGHEMTHGFDDQGRQFDAQGNLTDWWTPGSAARFKERASGIVRQFSGYIAVDRLHLNGELTQGENIADLGGLKVAFAAFRKALAGQPRAELGGFTPEKRFFISHATVWRNIMRPEEQRRRARVDPHAPGEWRVNGPLSNLDEFAAAFALPEGVPMRRPAADRVTIW
ncbi:MAG: M13 family peptidase [Opitutaceae bacterium]|nr:M13 family peptidase [Opitutaceae bacterium]